MTADIEKLIKSLQQTSTELNSSLEQIEFGNTIGYTMSKSYCFCIKLDGNQNWRLNDLVEKLFSKITDYAISRKEIKDAFKYYEETNSSSKVFKLHKKAKSLFTSLENSGEGGELLLYMLIEEYLKYPQLIGKMSLKTSNEMHYHGSDGIHVNYDSTNNKLNLYWGESKMYSDISSAITKCFTSLRDYLTDQINYQSRWERDIQLITQNITNMINNEELENILVRYFDKDDDLSNEVVYKGVCLIGFDFDGYNKRPAEMNNLIQNIKNSIDSWKSSIQSKLKSNGIHEKEIHVFLVPLQSVSEFRELFLKGIKS